MDDLFGPYVGQPVFVSRWDGDGPWPGNLTVSRNEYTVAGFRDGSGAMCHMWVQLEPDGIWRRHPNSLER